MKLRLTLITVSAQLDDALLSLLSDIDAYGECIYEHVVQIGRPIDPITLLSLEERFPRTKIAAQRDRSLYHALNLAIARCEGELVAFNHVGDRWRCNIFPSGISEIFEAKENVDLVYGNVHFVNNGVIRRTWNSKQYQRFLLNFGWMPPHTTVIARKSVYDRIGQFNEKFKISADYDWLLRVFTSQEYICVYKPELYVEMSVGGISNNSLKNLFHKTLEDHAVVKQYLKYAWAVVLLKRVAKLGQFFNLSKFKKYR